MNNYVYTFILFEYINSRKMLPSSMQNLCLKCAIFCVDTKPSVIDIWCSQWESYHKTTDNKIATNGYLFNVMALISAKRDCKP